jgi:hypothetical protein
MATPAEPTLRQVTVDDSDEPRVVTTRYSDDLPRFHPLSDLRPVPTENVPTSDTRGAAVPMQGRVWDTRGAAVGPVPAPEIAGPVVPIAEPAPPHRVPQPRRRAPRRGHVGPRSRPAIRRRTTSSSASSRGDPDLAGDEPPGHRPPSLLGAAA